MMVDETWEIFKYSQRGEEQSVVFAERTGIAVRQSVLDFQGYLHLGNAAAVSSPSGRVVIAVDHTYHKA